MAFEVACSQCEGRLMVEEAGVVVACPHCGAHLNIEAPAEPEAAAIDEPADSPDQQPTDDSPEQPDTAREQSVEAVGLPATIPDEPVTDVPAESVEQEPSAAETPINSEDATDSGVPTPHDTSVASSESEVGGQAVADSPQGTSTDDETEGAHHVASALSPAESASEEVGQHPLTADESLIDQAGAPNSTTNVTITNMVAANADAQSIASVSAGRGVSRHTFTLVRNYAIAMTLAVIFLVYKLLNPNMSALESLPDLKPPKKKNSKDDSIAYVIVEESAEMPPGHLLSLGQSQRFGNLKVTPIRVSKEPIEFVHHLGDTGVTREPGPEVVKLWFEFENLSSDQSIAPLDGLVYKRNESDWENIRSNNFVCRRSAKQQEDRELVFVYDHLVDSQWNLRDQNVEQEIAPGEKLTTYIPTSEEGVAQLMNSDEPLIWRVQFRKGYSPKNYGVTTVIEVAFESSDIGATAATQPGDEPASAPNA